MLKILVTKQCLEIGTMTCQVLAFLIFRVRQMGVELKNPLDAQKYILGPQHLSHRQSSRKLLLCLTWAALSRFALLTLSCKLFVQLNRN